jgi:hypothetical protein
VTQTYVDFETQSIEDYPSCAYEYAYDQGWTDGLPIIPATASSIERFVAAAARAGDELIGILPPRKGRVTVEVIAVNAIMAGCRPEYMPVIVAAVEALTDPGFRLQHLQVTTGSPAPFMLVNGPVRQMLDINFGSGCLGPGWRANATIGRAVRLILTNGGGALPGVYSKSCTASPLRYSYICGENEEANPWAPFHVDRGFARDASAVTVFYATSYCIINGSRGVGPDDILRYIATHMPPQASPDSALVLFGVNSARMLHEAGLSKREVQQRLWELARLPHSYFPEQFVSAERAAGRGDAHTLWRTDSPDKLHIAVAGGPGPYDVYMSAMCPQTRAIRTDLCQ